MENSDCEEKENERTETAPARRHASQESKGGTENKPVKTKRGTSMFKTKKKNLTRKGSN